jgi:site-specific recombinase XerD
MAPKESLESLHHSFNRFLRVQGRADRTITLYGQSITYFSRWLAQEGQPTDLSGLNRTNALKWLDSLRERGQTTGTVRTRWRGLRRFVGWLVAEEILTTDPLAGIAVDTPAPPVVPILTDADLGALLNTCKGRGFRQRRDEALIRLLFDCGLRVSELVGIDCKDLDLDAGSVAVTGKGSRMRMAYFGSRTALALDRYLRERRGQRYSADPGLLLSERGRLSTDGVRDRLKVRAGQAGLDPTTVHPHRFRHTWAHDFLLHEGQERDLKRLAGWSSDAMLSRYGASAADQRAREAAQRLRRGDRV